MVDAPRASRGRAVAEDQIDRLVREAEARHGMAELRRSSGRKPIGSAAARALPVRLDPKLDAAVEQRALSENSTVSGVILDALHA